MDFEDLCGYAPTFEFESISFSKFLLLFSEIVENTARVMDGHLQRTTYISAHLAETLGLSENEVKFLLISSLLHDIGLLFVIKLGFVEELDKLDRSALIDHGELGRWVVKEMSFLEGHERIAEIIRFHHVDYSPGLENRIPVESLVLVGADKLEVIARKYQQPWMYKKEIMEAFSECKLYAPVREAICKLIKDAPLIFWYNLFLSRRAKREYLEALLGDIPLKFNASNFLKISKTIATLVDFRSPVTSTHSARVSSLAEAIGEMMELPARKRFLLKIAGLLHDIGKLVVPIDILEKPARLSPVEYAIVQTHIYFSYRFLRQIGMPAELVEAASFHHERLDGSGYPFGITGDCMYIGARIMQVADVFAALCEKRPYKDRWDKGVVLSTIKAEVEGGRLCRKVYEVVEERFDELYAISEKAARDAKNRFEGFLMNVAIGKEKLAEIMGF